MPRFSIRWLMLLVLLVALFLSCGQMLKTREDRLSKSEYYRQQEREWRTLATEFARQSAWLQEGDHGLSEGEWKDEVASARRDYEYSRRLVEAAGRLAHLYERGANRPWMAMGTLPPFRDRYDVYSKK